MRKKNKNKKENSVKLHNEILAIYTDNSSASYDYKQIAGFWRLLTKHYAN